MKKTISILFFCLCCFNIALTQSHFFLLNNKGKDKIKFKLINNLIVFPVEVNGVELSFLLDTGVSKPIIFNILNISDSLKVNNTKTIYLRGLGSQDKIEALKSKDNTIKIGNAIKFNQDLYAIYNADLDFTPKLGVPIHGIIGYDVLKDFIVEINYSKRFLRLNNPNTFIYKDCKNCEVFNLEFHNNKPYMYGMATINAKNVPVKLLIDSGGSDAIWLFEDSSDSISSGNNYFNDFLGHGLNGSVYGKRSKIDRFTLKDFKMKNVNVAYPDESAIYLANTMKGRNGSVSGNILKRFNIILDYRRAKITLKKNGNFKKRFSYDKSGISLQYNGYRVVKTRYKDYSTKAQQSSGSNDVAPSYVASNTYEVSLKPAFAIVELRKGSPAEKAGLLIGDVILNINGKGTHNFTLQQITHFFHDEVGKTVKLLVDRNGSKKTFKFRLKNPFE